MKLRSILLIMVLTMAVLLTGCGGPKITQTETALEVGTEEGALNWESFISVEKPENYNISCDASKVDINTLGDYVVTYSIENKENQKVTTKDFTFKVQDTTAPEIKPISESVTLSLGDDANPLDLVSVTDNYDGEISKESITVEGSIDTQKKGTNTIHYTVTDSSGNEGTLSLQVAVIDPPISLGDVIISDTHGEFTLTDVSFQKSVRPTNPQMFYSYYENKEADHIYLVATGTFKNLGESAAELDESLDMVALYQNKYTYNGFVVGDTKGDLDVYCYVDPLSTMKFKYIIDVPVEVQESTSPLELTIQLKGSEAKKYIVRP